jgi:hypothetical protein
MGDKACSSAGNRAYPRRRGIKAVMPVKEDQKACPRKLGSKGGRLLPAFDPGDTRSAIARSAASAS